MKNYVRFGIYFVLFTFLIGAFIYLGEKDFKEEKNISDNQRFAQEYNIENDNPFVYVYGSEVVDVIKNKSGIIYLGFSSNEWSKYYVKYLNEVLNVNGVKKVYYYDLLKDRTKYTKYYRELESLLSDYLYELDNGTVRLSTPALIIVKDGKIVCFDDETALERNNMSPDFYWTNDKVDSFKRRIDSYIKGAEVYE